MPAAGTTRHGLTRKGEATSTRIVEAAAQLMYQQGVAGTSVEQVRAAARVSNSQVYHYDPDKNALVCAVIRYQTEQVLQGQEPLLSNLDSFDALTAWRDMLVQAHQARGGALGCPLGSLASEMADADETARSALVHGFARWGAAIRTGLHVMQQRGDLRPDADPERLALAALAALEGGLLLGQTLRDTAPLAAGLDSAIGYIHSFRA